MPDPVDSLETASFAEISQGEASLKQIRRWLAIILMRIETLIAIDEMERENKPTK